MKNTLIWTVGILCVIGGIALVGFIVWNVTQKTEPQASTETQFPSATTGQGIGIISVTLNGGDSVQTRDFLSDPTTHEDEVNKGYYYLGNQDPQTAPYVIAYIAETNYFNIEILAEPIGQSRRAAETYLMGALGISETQMCALSYTVSTPNSVNTTYAGTNLGFSFCPGAVKLPQ